MNDLKNIVNNKTKSLRRRKGSAAVVSKLEEISVYVSGLHDFLKKIQAGQMDDGIYTEATGLGSGVTLSPLIWQKVLKAGALEDIAVQCALDPQTLVY